MMAIGAPIREHEGPVPDDLFAHVSELDGPCVFRGAVAEWPLVQNSHSSIQDICSYLLGFYDDKPVTTFSTDEPIGGRIFYTDELERVNFNQSKRQLDAVLEELAELATQDEAPTLYVGSTSIDHYLPGLSERNSLPHGDLQATVRIWIGNQTTVAAHYDAMENIACVCAGQRRFTLFPPEQIHNLYVGPIDFTPAGQSISLVDLDNPDLERFPKFSEAQKHAMTVVMEPGDAIYIPAMWWHHVQGLDRFNILINHWWQAVPQHMGPPLDALLHALMNIRDLPEPQRQAWRVFFDHYVFGDKDEAAAHIPEKRRGVLGDISDDLARQLRASLRNKLNR
ncbi:MAG: cupin-like domain-containing protein [Woeseiaceae bacterium]|nr:cupin-like domain-containing protein [Woeseiaceae bacterium]